MQMNPPKSNIDGRKAIEQFFMIYMKKSRRVCLNRTAFSVTFFALPAIFLNFSRIQILNMNISTLFDSLGKWSNTINNKKNLIFFLKILCEKKRRLIDAFNSSYAC